MPRRNNPFGPKNRPLTRSKRKELNKKGIKTVNVSDPAKIPAEKYQKDMFSFLSGPRKRIRETMTGMMQRYGGKSDKTSIFSFIGEFLHNLTVVRSENAAQSRADETEKISIDFTSSVNKDQKGKFKRNTEAIGLETIEPIFGEKNVNEQLSTSVFQNVSLITNLPDKYFNDIQRMVFAQIGIDIPKPEKPDEKVDPEKVLQVTPVEEPQVLDLSEVVILANKSDLKPVPNQSSMIEKLIEIDGVNKSRAKLIARDQTQKVFSALEEARGKDSGMQWYMWSGADDNRERPTHRANNNKVFHVDFPPEETGPPGHSVNCRCRRRWLVSKSQIMNIKESDLGYTGKYKSKAREKLRSEQSGST
ncbi:minor capsid protein [Candidatus Pacearchaeota archaeon]|nr:minor capsid protein [Candidatus Pacearchaeota archaeon]